jgi:antitoxin (DNA-binding transcriptional repressor) of toxin-antitoxin stability system
MMTMKVVNINEAKAKLSEFLDAVERGEQVVICKRNQPVAELRAIPKKRTAPRTIGGATGIEMPPAFFDPMPDDWLDEFYNGPIFPASSKSDRVAERQPAYRRSRRKTPRK